MEHDIKLDMDRYSPVAKWLGIGALVLVVLAIFKSPSAPKDYDQRCYIDYCIEGCQALSYRLGSFQYDSLVKCTCKTNVTEIPVVLYTFNGRNCPPLVKDRRCDENFCEEKCVKEEGFLPYHSYLVLEGDEYVCTCHDSDVGWFTESYQVERSKCVI